MSRSCVCVFTLKAVKRNRIKWRDHINICALCFYITIILKYNLILCVLQAHRGN